MTVDPKNTEYMSSLHVNAAAIDKLKTYVQLLAKWQKAVNLVSGKTLPEAWDRHFVDSAQLLPLIPDGVRDIVDIGSGAGFPGLVLAVLRPDIQVSLVESDEKKCQFLKAVSRETFLSVRVYSERIENVVDDLAPDLVSARALASLEKLFDFVLPWVEKNPDLVMLFLKGEQAADEVEQAQKRFEFDVERFASETSAQGCILRIRNLRARL